MDPAPVANVFALTPADSKKLAALCGEYNANVKAIEAHFDVIISHRGNLFRIDGVERNAQVAEQLLRDLYALAEHSHDLSADMIQSEICQISSHPKNRDDMISIKVRKSVIRARNPAQNNYLKAIERNDVCIGVGPAGTGKTYLAVAAAAQALASDEVGRIVLVRPVVEAGERLGFLPGDIGQKVNPYLRPLYDALYEMLGFDRVGRLLEREVIELAPLAFMRGRTLNDAFIILDEAQNTTREQMKMFLTRIGMRSRTVITGDITQVDLPKPQESGLRHAVRILDKIDGISIVKFQACDVVRHPLVQAIVQAYDNEARPSAEK